MEKLNAKNVVTRKRGPQLTQHGSALSDTADKAAMEASASSV